MSMNSQKKAAVLACAILLTGTGAIAGYINYFGVKMQKRPIYPEGNRQVSTLPSITPSWTQIGPDQVMVAEVVETLGTENYVSRSYYRTLDHNPQKPIVLGLHMAYYTGMIDTVPHVPERCFVGGGLQQGASSKVMELPMNTDSWRVDTSVPSEFAGLDGELYSIRLSNDPAMSDAPGTRLRLPRGVTPNSPIEMRVSEFIEQDGGRIFAGYFFIANGGTKANANEIRQLAFNLNDDYAYYLKIQVTGSAFDSYEEFAQYAGEFVGEILGETMRCVPNWVDVQMGLYPDDNPLKALSNTGSTPEQ